MCGLAGESFSDFRVFFLKKNTVSLHHLKKNASRSSFFGYEMAHLPAAGSSEPGGAGGRATAAGDDDDDDAGGAGLSADAADAAAAAAEPVGGSRASSSVDSRTESSGGTVDEPVLKRDGRTGTSASPAAADGSGDGSVDGVAEVRGLGWFLAGTSSSLVNTPT